MLLSGGLDSTACAHFLQAQNFDVSAVFVDYAQAAAQQERLASRAISNYLSIPLTTLRIDGVGPSGAGELIGRNMLLISVALYFSRGNDGVIAMGIHSGTEYYDCSDQFLSRADCLAREQTNGRVGLLIPFKDWEKGDILRYALNESLPVAQTYSCEQGVVPACGHCASCRERKALQC